MKTNITNPHQLTKLVVLFASTCLALTPALRAVTPPPDGGYPNQNTAEGDSSLFNLTTGGANTAIGFEALFSNNTGSGNTAVGTLAMGFNTTGGYNTANGYGALDLNSTGNMNTAIGAYSLDANTDGSNNTGNGFASLSHNTTGTNNTGNGANTLLGNTTGNSNTACGQNALFNNTTGSSNIGIGQLAGQNVTTGSYNIEIGNQGRADDARTIRLGAAQAQRRTFIAGITGVTVAAGVAVVIGSDGQLGTLTSSARYKDEIKLRDKASEAILKLEPVTFHYKPELDPAGMSQFGLVAEQVEKVNPDLVARDEQGKAYTVRYEAVNAMLLNEFLKEHRRVEEQEHKLAAQDSNSQVQAATIRQLKSVADEQQREIKALSTTLKEQAAQIQKVSDELHTSRTAPQLVVDNQ